MLKTKLHVSTPHVSMPKIKFDVSVTDRETYYRSH